MSVAKVIGQPNIDTRCVSEVAKDGEAKCTENPRDCQSGAQQIVFNPMFDEMEHLDHAASVNNKSSRKKLKITKEQ
jgi:hypothetical protein